MPYPSEMLDVRTPSLPRLELELRTLARSSVGAPLLAQLDIEDVRSLADEYFDRDLHLCASIPRIVLPGLLGAKNCEAACREHVEHLVWCWWRTALWRAGRVRSSSHCSIQGTDNLQMTRGFPTVLLCPMSVPACEVLTAVAKACPRRQVVVYAEAPDEFRLDRPIPKNIQLVGNAPGSMATIVRALNKSALYCTYPDFVHDGHVTVAQPMFGRLRPFSRAFASLCARPHVHLLPLWCSREPNGIVASFSPPFRFEMDDGPVDRNQVRGEILEIVAGTLESLIRRRPQHWLLLGTLYPGN
jgi:lauroyl/myristoyl acyltransferase